MVTAAILEQSVRFAVLEALAVPPGDGGIGVTVDRGVVTLSGAVTTIAAKCAAEAAARRITGVRAVANDLAVWPAGLSPSTALARAILAALAEWGLDPAGRVIVGVQGGWVDLTGEIADEARRQAAMTLIGRLPGVKGVVDELALPVVSPADEAPVVPPAADHLARVSGRGALVAFPNFP